MDDILKYLAEVVTEWPDAEPTHVRLDKDGEVCFTGGGGAAYDFFPGDAFGGSWVAGECGPATSHKYTFAEWKEARERIAEPVGEIEWSPWVERTMEVCPVDACMTVSVKSTDGQVVDDRAAGDWGWKDYGGRPAEITHYRIPMEDYRRIYGEPDIEPDTVLQYEPNDVAFSAHSEEPMTGHDTVNAPSHYASGDIECIDAIQASMTAEEFEGYCKGNVQKYMWRWRDKGGIESLRKAEWYLRKLISVVE